MYEEELEIVNPLSDEPAGLEDVTEIGRLNFGQALRDCNLVVIRDQNNKVVPLTT